MSDVATKIAQKQVAREERPTMKTLVQAQQPAIEAQLAGAMNSGAFVRAALSTVMANEKLQQATPATVLGSIMLAAQLKLEIGSALGYFYLTPRLVSYNEDGQWKKRWECVPIIGYQGLIELAYRTGRIEKIETFLVRDGDRFEYGANSERGRYFKWQPADFDETRPWNGAVVTAKIIGAGTIWAYLPKDKILSRRQDKWEKGPWKTHEEEMARKTVVREIAPYLPKSTEFAVAVEKTRDVEEQGARVESLNGVHDLVVTKPVDQSPEGDGDPDFPTAVPS